MRGGLRMHEARALRTPWRAITLFLLPALTLYVAFTAYPVFRTFWNSLHNVLPARKSSSASPISPSW